MKICLQHLLMASHRYVHDDFIVIFSSFLQGEIFFLSVFGPGSSDINDSLCMWKQDEWLGGIKKGIIIKVTRPKALPEIVEFPALTCPSEEKNHEKEKEK